MQLAYISSCWSCEGLPKGHEGGHSAKGALVRGIELGQNLCGSGRINARESTSHVLSLGLSFSLFIL